MGLNRHIGCVVLLLALTACGTMQRSPRRNDAPVILPLTDSADIHRSRARAQAVADSIARIESGIRTGVSDGALAVKKDNPATSSLKKWRDKLLNLYHKAS